MNRRIMLAAAFLAAMAAAVALAGADPGDGAETSEGEFAVDGFTYTPLTGDTVDVTGYTGEETDVTVPSEVENGGVTYTVTAATGTFDGNEEVTSVVFPETLLLMDEYTLSGCSSLQRVYIPASVGVISGVMFEGCASLASVDIGEGGRYVSLGGAVYTSDGSELVYFPAAIGGTFAVPDGVESIGRAAFTHTHLESVDVGNVSEVGPFAFQHSAMTTARVVPGVVYGVSAYLGSAVQWLIVEDGVTEIPSGMFSLCVNLRTVTLPESVEAVGSQAFMGCASLTDVYVFGDPGFGGGAFDIGAEDHRIALAFHTLGGEVGESALGDNTDAAYEDLVVGGEGDGFVYDIYGDGYAHVSAYVGDSPDAVVPSHVVRDGGVRIVNEVGLAFAGNTAVGTVTLPATIDGLEASTFEGCSSLTRVDMHFAVNAVSYYMFAGCVSLLEVNVLNPNGSAMSVDGVLYSSSGIVLAYYPQGRTGTFVIPDGVQTVANMAFMGSAAEEVVMGADVSMVGDLAFAGSSLQRVTLVGADYGMNVYSDTPVTSVTAEEGFETVSAGMFSGCSQLRTVSLPASLAEIDDSAFSGCTALEELYVAGDGILFVSMDSLSIGTAEEPVSITIYTDRDPSCFDAFALGDHTTAEILPYREPSEGGEGDDGGDSGSVIWAVAAVILAAAVAGLLLGRDE